MVITNTINTYFQVYREPKENEFIICAADPGGVTGDPNRAVWKAKNARDTVMNFSANMEGTEFAYELYKGCMYIKNLTGILPVIMVERNTGGAVIAKLVELNYPNLYRMEEYDEVTQKKINKIGWHTNTFTRPIALDGLAVSLRKRENIIPAAEEINEFFTFTRNKNTGKPEGEQGCHDDYVIAESIAWQGVLKVDTPLSEYENQETPEWAHGAPSWQR